MFGRRWCDAALAGAALALPARAAAQEAGRFRFEWARDEGAERCPDGPSIAREVARRLGRDPFVAANAPSIEAGVRRVGGRWVARLVVRDAGDAPLGTREFTSDAADCDAIASAVTLGVALSIDPEAALRPPAPPPPAPPPPPPAVRAPQSPPSRAPGASVRYLNAPAGLLLPGNASGLALAVEGPLGGRLRLAGGLMYFPESAAGDAPFAFGLTAAWVAPCVDLWRPRAMSVTGCVGVGLGAVHAVVLDGARREPLGAGEQLWVSLQPGVRFRARIAGPLVGELGVEGVFMPRRYRFLNLAETAFQPGWVALVAFAGLGLHFP